MITMSHFNICPFPAVLLIIVFALLNLQAHGADWYVDSAATGEADGTSWADAWLQITNVAWASVSTDINGSPRNTWDIGAYRYEHGGARAVGAGFFIGGL